MVDSVVIPMRDEETAALERVPTDLLIGGKYLETRSRSFAL